jgi:IPTL-CTERM motif
MRNRIDTIVQSQSSAAVSHGCSSISFSHLVMTLATGWLFASTAFAGGGGIAGGCPTNQPCIELVAVAINGTPITPTSNVTVQPGDEIETNLFISGWGDILGLLRGYRVDLEWISPSESGTRGAVLPLGLHEPNGEPQRAAEIDTARADYVFFGKAASVQAGSAAPSVLPYRFDVGLVDSIDRAADDGVPRYAGTFRLVASAFACGEFAYNDASTRVFTGEVTPLLTTVAGFVPLRIGIGGGECDCNANGIDDFEEIASGTVTDCNSNGVPDGCEPDCQSNGIADECDILDGTSIDCDSDLIPDECESQTDCNNNAIRDECEVVGPGANDCNGNGVPDDCDGGSDCNGNGLLDSCDIAEDTSIDCQSNGVPDECDIASGTSTDNDGNGVPDECETYCALSACGPGSCISLKAVAINGNPIVPTNNVTVARGDIVEAEIWLSCWGADVGLLRGYQAILEGHDAVVSGDAGLVLPVGWDAPLQLIPCNSMPDCPFGTTCSAGQCKGPNHLPSLGAFIDMTRADYVLRDIDPLPIIGTTTLHYLIGGVARDFTGATDDGQPKYGGTVLLEVGNDACGEFTFDFITKSIFLISEFFPPDGSFTVVPGTQPLLIQTLDCDCNNNGVFDDEELATGAASDCNENGIPDSCDIASGTSPDADGNGTPDDCFVAIPTVSEWGLAVLAILLLVAAKLRFGLDRSQVA